MGNTTLWSPTTGDVTFPMTPPPATGGNGAVDNMAIGQTAQAPVGTNKLVLDSGTKTSTASAGAAELDKMSGVITSESLSTAAGSDYTLTLTNSDIAAADLVFASVQLGTATTGVPAVATVTPGDGEVVIVVQNIAASAAFNGTIKISFAVVKAS
jgi:hypothetical protein